MTTTNYTARGGKFYAVIVFEDGSSCEQGTDGDVAWKISEDGPRILTGDQKAELIRNADVFQNDWRSYYSKVEPRSSQVQNGRRVYEVVITPTVGHTRR